MGAAVNDARRHAGLTQQGLADKAGVSRGWIIRFERGHRAAELESVLRVLSALGLTLTLGTAPDAPTEAGTDDVADARPVVSVHEPESTSPSALRGEAEADDDASGVSREILARAFARAGDLATNAVLIDRMEKYLDEHPEVRQAMETAGHRRAAR